MLRIIVLELYITGVLETAATKKKNITDIVIPFCFFFVGMVFFSSLLNYHLFSTVLIVCCEKVVLLD